MQGKQTYSPVLGVTHAHFLFPCTTSGGGTAKSSETFFSALSKVLPILGVLCLRLLVKLVLPIFPVEVRLQNESVDASEEQEALSDRLDCSSISCLLITEGALKLDLKCGRAAEGLEAFFFPSAATISVLSVLLGGFEAGFRTVAIDLALFPPGTRTGLASESLTLRERTLGAPDMSPKSNLFKRSQHFFWGKIDKNPALLQKNQIKDGIFERQSHGTHPELGSPKIATQSQGSSYASTHQRPDRIRGTLEGSQKQPIGWASSGQSRETEGRLHRKRTRQEGEDCVFVTVARDRKIPVGEQVDDRVQPVAGPTRVRKFVCVSFQEEKGAELGESLRLCTPDLAWALLDRSSFDCLAPSVSSLFKQVRMTSSDSSSSVRSILPDRWRGMSPESLEASSLGMSLGAPSMMDANALRDLEVMKLNWSGHSINNVPSYLSEEESILVGRLKEIFSSSRAVREMTELWLVEVGLSPASRAAELEKEVEKLKAKRDEAIQQLEASDKYLNEAIQ
ncbi:hypothetical protein GW17_00017612 [Ensete ventricosum]|nr:hypothetical protein GW17_00017612 [Ensete ventricosum]